MESLADADRVVRNRFLYLFGQGRCRVDRERVTGVHTGTFDVLHDARNENVFAIGDRIDLTLFAHDILVDQDRRIV